MTFQARCPLAGGEELLRTEISGCSPASKLARRVELLRIEITLGEMEIFDRNVFWQIFLLSKIDIHTKVL